MAQGVEPYYVRDTQPWAVQQERMRHEQALWALGELSAFALMWTVEDHERGLVQRCHRCYASGNSTEDKVAAIYNQPTQNKCPVCYGTTFEGGFRAIIVRPTIWDDTDPKQQWQAKGVVQTESVNIQSTYDFRVRDGDYAFRASGERFYLRTPQRTQLRTGFDTPQQATENISYNLARATREAETSVAYLLPPSGRRMEEILERTVRIPGSFKSVEIVRVPLIPDVEVEKKVQAADGTWVEYVPSDQDHYLKITTP